MTVADGVRAAAPGPEGPAASQDSLAQRIAGSALNLAGRRAGVLLFSGLATAGITRLLGPSHYGQYASAIATWSVLGTAADFGFSHLLSRDLATDPARRRPMLRAAYQVGMAWALALTAVQIGVALLTGVSTTRGLALLVLAPGMAINGLNAARALFLVVYRTRDLAVIDVACTAVQAAGVVAVAAAGLGPVGVAAVVCFMSIVNTILPVLVAKRMLPAPAGERFGRWELLRRSAPLGLVTIMTQVYLTIDLVILPWLAGSVAVGKYAAASKLLAVLTSVTALVMNAALPALAVQASQRQELEALVARVWHWLVVTALPIFLATALFAPLVVRVAVGSKYGGADSLLRILSLAGVIAILSNFLSVIMIAVRRTRTLFAQSALAITVNLTGNLILVPSIGVKAAAWMTVATEAMVCVGDVLVLAHHVNFTRCLSVSVRPLLAAITAAALGLALHRWTAVAVPAAAFSFLALVSLLNAWPPELRARLPRLGWARRAV